jgi:hypothetical protein
MNPQQNITNQDLDLLGPSGEILHLEDVASIRAITINNLMDDTYFVTVVDVQGTTRHNYLCTFKCLNYLTLMLFVEDEKEDKTQITINFESLMTLLTKSRNLGYSEAAGDAEEGEESESAMEALMSRESNAMLN